jgi:hypothetical protein
MATTRPVMAITRLTAMFFMALLQRLFAIEQHMLYLSRVRTDLMHSHSCRVFRSKSDPDRALQSP